ncbi:DUF3047 domain-containing protein [Desulfocurvibacter africanus]|uniref:DUF3047 domain-containing protein n=1 Tax=Desulfocurvibacter africanus TaxID=873 RepID=UPI002FDA8C7E
MAIKASGLLFAKLRCMTLAVIILAHPVCAVYAQEQDVFFRENFESLDAWKPLIFPKIERHSSYEIVQTNGDGILRASSSDSASGLVLKRTFDPYRFPILRWRWKVEGVYAKADPHSKEGDDYPLRVYVLFEYDPDKVGFWQKAKYELAKAVYGEYPPLASLNYVWSSSPVMEPFYENPYTDRARMIPLQSGDRRAGQWVMEQVNVLDDYRKAFGEDPPTRASLAIMNDSDNTGEASVSYMDFIEVRRNQVQP